MRRLLRDPGVLLILAAAAALILAGLCDIPFPRFPH
jgi:hypothetical protein